MFSPALLPAAYRRAAHRAAPLPAHPHGWRLAALLACTALVTPGLALAQALPQGGQFVAGQGSIGTATANALTITQTSARGIIDWRSFNVGQGASVTVNNGAGATLNRVTGGDLSQILGSLRATGSLYLVNPQGVVIGSSGVVVTGGRFVASSLDIANDAFMAGGTLVFRGSTENAEVRNLGAISSTGGDVILISRSVRNEGSISAPRGTAALAAGTEVLLREGPDGHRGMVRVSGASGDVTNTGRIEAAQAELRTAGGNIYALAGNTEGIIRATGTETRNGRVWLSARGAGGNVVTEGRIEARNADGTGGKVSLRAGDTVRNTGTLSTDGSRGGAVRVRAARVVQQGTISARGTNGAGGTVHVMGDHIVLTGAQIDASGTTGGGVVRIGGGVRGGEGLPQASTVAADAATTIRADATQRGNGGDVVVWSENRTDFAGTISARGGAEGGDGGQAEVSSRGVLAYTGTTDLRAAHGAWGTLLLDPYNITISTDPTQRATNDTSTNPNQFRPTGDDSIINANDLMTALGMANVIVSTGLVGTAGSQAGDITVTAPLAWTGPSTLTLEANRNIIFNADGTITAMAGGLTLQAGGTITANAAVNVGRFELLSGAWEQTAAPAAFSASDFRLTGGTFLRSTGGAVLGGTDAGDSSANPWLLTDIYGVQGMATRRTEHYRLANNIDATGTANWNRPTDPALLAAGFRPIGADTTPTFFTGSLDGAGHTINGLVINTPAQQNVGLFGRLGTNGRVENLSLTNADVRKSTAAGSIGVLVGTAGTGSVIANVRVAGTVEVDSGLVGGLVGTLLGSTTAEARIEGSSAAVAISAMGSVATNAGGLVGRATSSSIIGSFATGHVVAQPTPFLGGLVGVVNSSHIEASYATGNVTSLFLTDAANAGVGGLIGRATSNTQAGQRGTTIRSSYATGAVSGRTNTGGLIGSTIGGSANVAFEVADSYATGAVQGTTNVGGLIGEARAGFAVRRAYALGSVTGTTDVGGLVGLNTGTVTQSYATGAVSGPAGAVGPVGLGGLVGRNSSTSASDGTTTNGTITASFWDTETTGRADAVGRQPGTIPITNTSGLTTAQARSAASYTDAGWDFTSANAVWFQAADMRPILRAEVAQPGTDDVRVIRNLNQLQLMAANLGGSYRLGNDIDAAATGNAATNPAGIWGTGGFVPVGTDAARFAGSLDGAGRSITGLTINRPTQDKVGLFGATNSTSTIRDIGLRSGSVTGQDAVGGLVGDNRGAVTRAFAAVTVTGRNDVGGLVGDNSGGITDTYATGAVTGTANVGGLVGTNQASGTVTRTYATGVVTGTTNAGGLVGANNGEINASVWNTTVNGSLPGVGSGSTAGATGRNTAQMQDLDTFRTTYAGWDFDTVWSPPNQAGQGNLSGPGAGSAHYPELYAVSTVAAVFPTDLARVFGDPNPTLSVARTAGLRSGDSLATAPTLSTAADIASPVGTYAISGSGSTIASPAGRSYRIVHVPGTLTIAPRPITVTADAQSRVFGTANPPLTYQIGGRGLVGNDTLSGQLATAAGPSSNVGDYPITQGSLTASSNYALSFVGNTLTITPGTLIVTAEDARRRQWQPNPVFTFRTTGFVVGDTASVIRGLELVTPATQASRPGAFPITPVGGSAANYTLVRVDGILTVEPSAENREQEPTIGTSNVPPPTAQLAPAEAGIQLAAGGPRAAVPLQAASNACGAGAGMDVLRCATGFPTPPN